MWKVRSFRVILSQYVLFPVSEDVVLVAVPPAEDVCVVAQVDEVV